MREVPQPSFERDVKQLVKAYEQALKDVQAELNSLFLTDFERAQILATERNIQHILSDLIKYGDEWVTATISEAALEGVAATVLTLDIAVDIADARRIAKFSEVNRRLVDAMIADTQADLLAMTQNVERQAKLAIRKAVAEAMRYKLTRGINATDNIAAEIKKRIIDATDVAIIDRRGRRWKVETYADMVARTKAMQAHREASINEALSEDAYYGVVSRHGATDACRHYEGKVVKLTPDAPGDFEYIGDIPRNRLFHPACKHLITPIRRLDRLPDDLKKLNKIKD